MCHQSSAAEQVTIEILAKEYMEFMVDQGSISFTCVGKIQENSQAVTAARVVRLEVPALRLKVCTSTNLLIRVFSHILFAQIVVYEIFLTHEYMVFHPSVNRKCTVSIHVHLKVKKKNVLKLMYLPYRLMIR